MSETLKPCPFCGSEPELEEIYGFGEVATVWEVGCRGEAGCLAKMWGLASKAEAIAAWNRRTPAQEQREPDGWVWLHTDGTMRFTAYPEGVDRAEMQCPAGGDGEFRGVIFVAPLPAPPTTGQETDE